jgi:hypothetical protein
MPDDEQLSKSPLPIASMIVPSGFANRTVPSASMRVHLVASYFMGRELIDLAAVGRVLREDVYQGWEKRERLFGAGAPLRIENVACLQGVL